MAYLLLESGSKALLEDGFDLLLEDGAVVEVTEYGYVCLAVAHPSCTITVSKDC